MTPTDKWIIPTCGVTAIGVSILALQNADLAFGSTKLCEKLVAFALTAAIVVGAINVRALMATPRANADLLVAYAALLVVLVALVVHALGRAF